MTRPLDIGIVGAGTAGSAAALFLSRAGHRVTVYERVEDPKPVGAGILLQPTGQAVLRRLGLLGPILDHGARVDALRCRTSRGRELFHLRYGDLDTSLFGLGLHRGTLFQTLFEAVRSTPAIHLKLGVELTALAKSEGGRFVVDAHGVKHGPHELVVVADGAGSQLRDDEPIPQRTSIYPWGAVWHVTHDAERTFTRELFQVVEGAQTMLGFLPTGCELGAKEPVVSIFWSIARRDIEAFRAKPVDAWKARIHNLEPRARGFLDNVQRSEDLVFAIYRDVKLARFHGDHVVYLGDAAHAMSPQLGQGANLALFDALVLAESLTREDALRDALAGYTRERWRHVRFYQFASRWLTPFFQGDSRFLGMLRDIGFPLSRLGLLRDPMIRTMAGLRRGIVRPSLPLDRLHHARLGAGNDGA